MVVNKLSIYAASLCVAASLLLGHSSRTNADEAPGADSPDKAFEWRRLAWLDENGNLDPGAYLHAVAQRDANAHYWGDLTDSTIWVERGPFNIMGRTRSLCIDPNTPTTMFAGTVGGGIWKTTNGGSTWNIVDDRFRSLAIGCMTRDPNNPNVIYAGTGEGFFNGDAIGGAGIYKSIDGGNTWSLINSTAGFSNVCRIAICPSNSNLILVSTRYYGIQRSTDGGNTWTNPYWAQGSYQVMWHPTDPNKAIAHIIDYNSTDGWFHRAMYSNDAGATWTPAATGLNKVISFNYRLELAYAPSNPSIVYASCAINSGVIFKSVDGGVNYTQVTVSGTSGCSWYACPIWVDPTNPNFIVVGGTYFYKSIDGGVTLTKISNGYIMTANAHPDEHCITPSPGYNGLTNKTVYVTTDGGVYRADDITTANTSSGWVNLDQACRSTQYYGADGDGASGRIVGGTQDNGHHTLNTGSNNAVLTFGGDGGFAAIDWTNPLYGYGEYVYAQVHRSSNGGASAGYFYSGISDAGSGNTANFISPFILDPNQANTMLVGGMQLWRTTNARGTPGWTSIRPAGTDKVSAIAIAPGNSNIIWVGQNNGIIQKTANGASATPTWTDVDNNSSPNPLPNRYVTRIVIDPANSNVVYVALGGFSTDNLWKTTDGGTNWTDITGSGVTGLPDVPIRGFARHPNRSDWLFAGTEVGLFESIDGGANWSTSDFGPANVAIYEATFMHNSYTLLLATHGRGLWTTDLPSPDTYVSSFSMARGSVASGGIPEMSSSDDAYLMTLPGPLSSSADYPIQLVADGISPFQTPGTFKFTLESSATASGVQQTIEFYDWNAGLYEVQDTRTILTTDGTVTVTGANPARFVQSGTKLVRSRLRWKNTIPVPVWPWKARIDLAKWSIWP